MLTEPFLNSCFSVILNQETEIRKDKILFRDVLEILRFHKEKERIDIPMQIQNKFDCLVKICEMKLEDKTDANVFDSIVASEKFKPLSDFLDTKMSEKLSDEALRDNINQIRIRKKLSFLLKNYDKLDSLLETVKDGSFETMDDVVGQYEDTIKHLFVNMMESNRCVAVEASASLDLKKDDYDHVLDMILEKYSSKNVTPTGFQIFDNEILSGGFEPSRLYMIGGGSSAGKSTILSNFIINSATRDSSLLLDPLVKKDETDFGVYVYVTLENTIDESLMRMYQALFNKSTPQVIRDIKSGINIKKVINSELKKTNSTIIIKYFRPQSISSLDLTVVLDDIITEYGENKIKGLYVDYLDLLKPDVHFEQYRLELSHITLALKSIAVEYNIPVIVPTQLTRSVYRVDKAHDLNLDQMSEAIKKVEHSDWVLLLAKNSTNENLVHAKVGKNRSGPANVVMDFDVDFSIYKFITGRKVTNEKRFDTIAPLKDGKSFSGLGNEF